MNVCEIPSGRAKRAANFRAISERGETFPQVVDRYRAEGREFPSISEIRALVVRAGRCLTYFDDETGEEKKLNSTHIHLWDLLLTFTNLRDWIAGQPVAWPSNQLIGSMLGIDPGYVPRLLRPLEAVGACIREYTRRNRRHGAGGLDMAPTFFLLADLRAHLEAIHQDLDDYRASLDAREVCEDAVGDTDKSPGQGELFSRRCRWCGNVLIRPRRNQECCCAECREAWERSKRARRKQAAADRPKGRCLWCDEEFDKVRQGQDFCCSEHQQAFNNFWKGMGPRLAKALHAWRVGKAKGGLTKLCREFSAAREELKDKQRQAKGRAGKKEGM